jgi:enoyl-CoA hydratase
MDDQFPGFMLSRPLDGVALVTINRPEARNAMTDEMFGAMVAIQDHIAADTSLRCVIITGAGEGFCAGLDLDLAARTPEMPAKEMYGNQQRWVSSILGFTRLPIPVIAAVNGAAAGGGLGVALAADIRIASTTARFNAAFVRIGLSAGDIGVSWALPRLIGLGRAMEIMLTGRFVDSAEALAIGLVTQVVEPDDLLNTALATASSIIQNSPFGMQLTKEVVLQNVDAPSLAAAVALEDRTQVLANRSPDMAEALAAFREKRSPVFQDR